MADPVTNSPAPVATAPISFTDHPIDYVIAKAEAAIDSFTSEPAPRAPAAAPQRSVAVAYYSSEGCDQVRGTGGARCQ